jgi:hypothetical protein
LSSARGKIKDAVCYDAPTDHDPLCVATYSQERDPGPCWICSLIARVRAEERDMVRTALASVWQHGYEAGHAETNVKRT